MSSICVHFKTDYKDYNRSYVFNRETTIESMLLTFIKDINSRILKRNYITLDPIDYTYQFGYKILNSNSNSILKKQIKDIFKQNRNPIVKVTENQKVVGIYTFISFGQYKDDYISLHKKLSEFFDENYSNLNYDSTYKQNFINFINSTNIKEKSTIIEWVNKIKSGTVQEFIKAYTGETPLCYLLNKWLRYCNKHDFEKIKYFAGPFSYSLYKYANDNSKMKVNFSKKFYRKMVLKEYDYQNYKYSIGELICYPSFTSTSEEEMTKYSFPTSTAIEVNNIKNDDIYVVLIIDYKCNNSSYPTPCINVSYDSINSVKNEYIFPPFSFFKIEKVEDRSGISSDPHIIYMTVPNKRVLIEFAIKNNKTIYYDEDKNELYSS